MNSYHRKAMSYVLVLGTVMVLTVIGLSALTTMRVRWRSMKNSADFIQARLYAQSAIGLGLLSIENNGNWREVMPNGLWVDHVPIGTGLYSIEGIDPNDGNLADSETQPVFLTGIGYQGDARYKLRVTLQAQPVPISALEVSLHSANDILIYTAVVTSDQIISANNSVSATDSAVNADVEAMNNILGTGYTGTTTTGIALRTMPRNIVFDYYLANGTPIAYGDLTTGQFAQTIEKTVLSPASNPYGTGMTNAEGIYVIDCGGGDITIMDSRIVGTLLLINPGPNSTVQNAVNWEPAVPNFPALLVSGNMKLIYNAALLSEQKTGKTNLNPPGTPYNGESDNDTNDSYPSEINGLIYVSGDVTAYGNVTVKGLVIVGTTLTLQDPNGNPAIVNLSYGTRYLESPPPGFTDIPNMIIAAGSWRQVVD